MSDSATHGLQYASLPCPSLSPRVCSNSCPLSWWYYPTVSSSVVPFSSCLQSFPASGSFPMKRLGLEEEVKSFLYQKGMDIGFTPWKTIPLLWVWTPWTFPIPKHMGFLPPPSLQLLQNYHHCLADCLSVLKGESYGKERPWVIIVCVCSVDQLCLALLDHHYVDSFN